MGFRAYSLGSSPTLEIIDRTHFQVLSRNLRPEWLQLARALSKNTPGGVLGVHDADETLPGSTKKRVRGFRNERFCYIVCSFCAKVSRPKRSPCHVERILGTAYPSSHDGPLLRRPTRESLRRRRRSKLPQRLRMPLRRAPSACARDAAGYVQSASWRLGLPKLRNQRQQQRRRPHRATRQCPVGCLAGGMFPTQPFSVRR